MIPLCNNFNCINYANSVNSIYNKNNINLLLTPVLSKYDNILLGSILLETISTICLKKTLNNKLWYIASYTGYGISFYLFPKCLQKYKLNIAYSIWCGIGIIMTMLYESIFCKEIITLKKAYGSIIIIFGIYLLK